MMAWASTVAVVVPSPASSDVLERLPHHLRAHILELVLQLDSFATDTPSLVMVGRPKLSRHRVAAFRTQCCLDGVSEDIHAPETMRWRCVVAESDFFCCHV